MNDGSARRSLVSVELILIRILGGLFARDFTRRVKNILPACIFISEHFLCLAELLAGIGKTVGQYSKELP